MLYMGDNSYTSVWSQILDKKYQDIEKELNLFKFDEFDEKISSDDSGHLIRIATPGLNKKDIALKLEKNILTVSFDNKDGKCINSFDINPFTKRYAIPTNVDQDGITANYKAGVLIVSLPLKEDAKPKKRKIEIS